MTLRPYSYRFRAPDEATTLTIKARVYNLDGLYSDSQEVVLNIY